MNHVNFFKGIVLFLLVILQSCKIDSPADPNKIDDDNIDINSGGKPYDGRLLDKINVRGLDIVGEDAIFDGKQWVAVGDDIYISSDAVKWERINTGFSTKYNRIAWNGSLFVVVGPNRVITSTDGRTWTSRTVLGYGARNNDGSNIDLIWNGKEFMITTANYTLYKSLDGMQWESIGNIPAIKQLVWGNGILIGTPIGVSYRTLYSKDRGVTWTRSSSLSGGAITQIVYGNGVFYGFGHQSVYTSTDGTGWTQIKSGVSHGNNIIYSGNSFYSLGNRSSGDITVILGVIKKSQDGVTWTELKTGTHGILRRLIPSPANGFLALGNEFLWSRDGSNWEYRIPKLLSPTRKVKWAKDRAVITGTREGFLVTKDAINFELLGYLYRGNGFSSATWTGEKYIAIGERGRILSSSDGVNFTSHNTSLSENLVDIVSSPKGIVAVGNNGAIAFSRDGSNWQKASAPEGNPSFTTVDFINDRFMALSTRGIFSSSNGIDWTLLDSKLQAGILDRSSNIVYDGKVYVAICDNGRGQLFLSKDAREWHELRIRPNDPFFKILALQYTGNEFLALTGQSATDCELIASNDGISWSTVYTFPSETTPADFVWTGRSLVFVGGYHPPVMIGEINL